MSEDNDTKPKVLGVKIRLTECDRGGMHVTDVAPITDESIIYDAPDCDDVLASSTLGWSRAYANNWDANFVEKPADDLTN